MIQVNFFNSVTEPMVKKTIPLNCVFEMVKNGGEQKPLMDEAKQALLMDSDKNEYERIKVTLPCVSYSFLFNKYRRTHNIIQPTGLLAIDVDGSTTLPDNKLVYVAYKSLSTTGLLILIRARNLNPHNYRYNIELVSQELGVNADLNAAKVTQPFILPHDPSIYINDNSEVWETKEPKNTHFIPEKKERVIGTELGTFSKVRFNNLNDYTSSIDFDGEAIFDFKEKFEYASLYVPITRITEGNRNKIFSGIGYQFRCLNTTCTLFDIENLLYNINEKYGQPKLPNKEIKSISKSIFRIPIKDLVPVLNDTKRFIFNPDYDLTLKEKRSLVMTSLNKGKAVKTKEVMAECIDNWDFSKRGKITQNKLAEVTGKNIKTIRTHYSNFKSLIKLLNNKNKPP